MLEGGRIWFFLSFSDEKGALRWLSARSCAGWSGYIAGWGDAGLLVPAIAAGLAKKNSVNIAIKLCRRTGSAYLAGQCGKSGKGEGNFPKLS